MQKNRLLERPICALAMIVLVYPLLYGGLRSTGLLVRAQCVMGAYALASVGWLSDVFDPAFEIECKVRGIRTVSQHQREWKAVMDSGLRNENRSHPDQRSQDGPCSAR